MKYCLVIDLYLIKLIIVVIVLSSTYLQADFTRIEQFNCSLYNRDTDCLAWGDCNGDSYLDMFVGNIRLRVSYLYINNQNGSYSEYPLFGGDDESAAAWGDFDGDGDMDLAIGRFGGQNYIYINSGQGIFIDQIPFGNNDCTNSIAWGDYDNDGDLDLAVINFIQNCYVCINNGDGTLTEHYIDDSVEYCYGWGGAWGDYDNDGDLDLAVARTYDCPNYLYINNGDGTFNREQQFGYAYTISLAWGDYDNDGDLDLAVGNAGVNGIPGGPNYLYINNGDGTFKEEIQFGEEGNTQSIAWGDYDNDGDLDLAVGNITNNPPPGANNYLYSNNGDGTFTEIVEFGTENTKSMVWGDFDDDGDIDLVCGNDSKDVLPDTNYLYINNENDDDYLNVHLIGHYYVKGDGYSNRDAIGAKVVVYAPGHLGEKNHLLGFREIEANGGRCGQDSIEAEFGIPNQSEVDILVIWPGSNGSHIEEYWKGVSKGQFLTLHEGTGTTYLNSDTKTISAASGGIVNYSIDAWPKYSFRQWLLGTVRF